MQFNVLDFGAVGDGKTKCKQAIQTAIDTCSQKGGGRVYFPSGTYLTGTLYMRNFVHLDLEPGAVILGSPDLEDYNAPDEWPQNWTSKIEKANGRHLIVGVEVSHVSISGGGRIDGNRKAFFDPALFSRTDFTGTRPSQMVYFCESDNIAIENVELFNSTYWTCFVYGCEDVRLTGLTIRNDQSVWNSDGLDIDSCARVTVSDCNIIGADDCIAIRGSIRTLKDKTRVCEDIVVTNCVLCTKQAGVRLGVGDGTIRRCCLSNLTMKSVGMGIVILTTYRDCSIAIKGARPEQAPECGTAVSDVLIDNIYMNTRLPISIMNHNQGSPFEKSGHILENITIRGIRGRGWTPCIFQGNHDFGVRNIVLSDIDLTYYEGKQIQMLQPGQTCADRPFNSRPYAFYIANVDGMVMNNVRLKWDKNLTGPWTHALLAANSKLEMNGCQLEAPPNGVSVEILEQWNEFL